MKSLIAVPFLIGSLPLLGSVAIGYNYLKSKRKSNKYLFWGGISGFAFAGWMASNMIMTRYTESLDFDAESNATGVWNPHNMPHEYLKLESIHSAVQELAQEYKIPHNDETLGLIYGFVEDLREPYFDENGDLKNAESFNAEDDEGRQICDECGKVADYNVQDVEYRWNLDEGEFTGDGESRHHIGDINDFYCEDCYHKSGYHAESFSAETWTEDMVCLKCNNPFDGCSCERCPQCDEFWNDGWLNCDECFSCDDCCRESCPHLWEAESKFVKPYDRRGKIDFRRDNKGRYRRKLSIPLKKK